MTARLVTERYRADPDGPGYLAPDIFKGFTVIADPCPTYESRSWPRRDGSPGVCYGSHAMKLATEEYGGRGLYVLVTHGGGHERLTLPAHSFNGEFADAIKAMPERLQYAALYSLWTVASDAQREAQSRTAARYAQAFIDGRLKKSRAKQGRRTVTIEPAGAPA